MYRKSQVRGDRSFAAMPEVESRPETEVAPDVEHPAEVEITVPIIDEEDLGTSRPETTEKLFFIIRNKCSSERTVRGTKGPGFIRSRERKFPGTNGPGNEWSMNHSFPRTKVPPWERIVLGTNSLENECSIIQLWQIYCGPAHDSGGH